MARILKYYFDKQTIIIAEFIIMRFYCISNSDNIVVKDQEDDEKHFAL